MSDTFEVRAMLDSGAIDVCSQAVKLVKQECPLDLPHVMLAAVRANRARSFVGCPVISQILSDRLVGRLEDWLSATIANSEERDLNPNTQLWKNDVHSAIPVTDGLRRCLEVARDRYDGNEISTTGLVWAILSDSNPLSRVLSRWLTDDGIDGMAALQELARRVASECERPAIVYPPHLTPVKPLFQYEGMPYLRHHSLMGNNIKDRLAECNPEQEIVTVIGRGGSPIEVMPTLLASHLAHPNSRLAEAVGGCMSVVQTDLAGHLTELGAGGRPEHFQQAIEYARRNQAILVVKHAERLAPRGQHEQMLLNELLTPQGARIIALYEIRADDANPESVTDKLGFDDSRLHPAYIDPYEWPHTLNVLHDYFMQDWMARGFAFQGVPHQHDKIKLEHLERFFEDALRLDYGIRRVNGKPLTMPYMIIEAIHSLLDNVKDAACMRNVIKAANDRLAKLRPDSDTDPEVREYYDRLLEPMRKVISTLGEQFSFAADAKPFELKRAYLLAWLFGSPRFEFHYPATIPSRAPARAPSTAELADGPTDAPRVTGMQLDLDSIMSDKQTKQLPAAKAIQQHKNQSR